MKSILRTATYHNRNDIKLTYTDDGTRAEIELEFEDEGGEYPPDRLAYGADSGTSMRELANDLLEELSGWLDEHYPSNWDGDDYLSKIYCEYLPTPLFAFESILRDIVNEEERE